MKLHTAEGTLTPVAPFDFRQSLAFLDMFGPMAGEQVLEPGAVTKALKLRGQVIVFRVESEGTPARPALRYRLHSAKPISAEAQKVAAQHIADFLSIDDPVGEFYDLAQGDAALQPALARLRGLHQVRFLTPIEIATWAVLTQRNPIPLAKKTKLALMERYGGALEVGGVRHLAFPEAADLAGADADELAAIIRHERRTRYVRAVAQAFAGQSEDFLRRAPYAEVEAWLRDIDGIGEWSSSFVLFRGLGRIERLPLSPPIQACAREAYGKHLSPIQMRALAEKYGAWQGYWALYLRA